MNKTISVLLFSLLFVLIACEKKAGFGGNAFIKGNIHTQHFNSTFTSLLSEYNATDYDVFIIPEGYVSPEKKIVTNYEGNFEFRYLYPGKYTIYAYSKDSTLHGVLGPETEMKKEVEITKNDETITVDTIVIFE